MSRCMIFGWPEEQLAQKESEYKARKHSQSFQCKDSRYGDSQSSCRYANPFAEPRAIFILVGQFIVDLSFPAMLFFSNKTVLYFGSADQDRNLKSLTKLQCQYKKHNQQIQSLQVLTMKMKIQGVVWDKLINKHPLCPSNAISNQWNKMFVMDTANDFNLCPKFTLALETARFQLFDCHCFLITKDSFMYITKTTLTKEIGTGESICRHG